MSANVPVDQAPDVAGAPGDPAPAGPPPVAEQAAPPRTPYPAAGLPSLTAADAGVGGHFFDAATWENIPHGSDACLYGDGDFAVPANAAKVLELRRARYITVTGDWRRCSIIDYERLNPDYSPPRLRGFVRGRKASSMDAIVYCNQSTAAEAVGALRDFGYGSLLTYPRLFWWIATLDNIMLTAAQLAAQLTKDWDTPEITLVNLWANQVTDTGLVDISNRFLPWLP